MTIADAIVEFEKQLHSAVVILDSGFGKHPGENDRIYRKRKELAEIALHALRAQQEAEKNEPLTLDELREMDDGEPVWIAPAKPGGKIHERWMLFICFSEERGSYLFHPKSGIAQEYSECNYSKTWLAYRHKPKEGKPNDQE